MKLFSDVSRIDEKPLSIFRVAQAAVVSVLFTVLGLAPALADAQPIVIVDSIPEGGRLINKAEMHLPVTDLRSVSLSEFEANLNSALSRFMNSPQAKDATYMCLLAPAEEYPVDVNIVGARQALKLRAIKPTLTLLFFQGGRESEHPVRYAPGKASGPGSPVSIQIGKVSVPQGWTSDMWLYFNLSRIQVMASANGIRTVFIDISGTGPSSQVNLPGTNTPFTIPDDDTKLTASWMNTGTEATANSALAAETDPAISAPPPKSMSLDTFPENFRANYATAKRLSETPEGKIYSESIAPIMNKALASCTPGTSPPPGYFQSFALVARIAEDGKVLSAEVGPESSLSSCFTKALGGSELPPPPMVGGGEGYLIAFELVVR